MATYVCVFPLHAGDWWISGDSSPSPCSLSPRHWRRTCSVPPNNMFLLKIDTACITACLGLLTAAGLATAGVPTNDVDEGLLARKYTLLMGAVIHLFFFLTCMSKHTAIFLKGMCHCVWGVLQEAPPLSIWQRGFNVLNSHRTTVLSVTLICIVFFAPDCLRRISKIISARRHESRRLSGPRGRSFITCWSTFTVTDRPLRSRGFQSAFGEVCLVFICALFLSSSGSVVVVVVVSYGHQLLVINCFRRL